MTSQPVPITQAVIPQALRLPYFPAMTTLDPPGAYDGGLPIRAVEDDLLCILRAWLTMAVGDRVDLFFGNATTPIVSRTLTQASEVDKDVLLTIPKAQVPEGVIEPVFYRVTRKNQSPEDSTPALKLLAKFTRPGDYDKEPDIPGHSELKYSLDITDVDPTLPAKGVTMRIAPYPHIAENDRIIGRWGSEQIEQVVTQQQATNPGAHPLDVVFSRALIEKAGDGPGVHVGFQPVDWVRNFSDPRAPWSAMTRVPVDLGGNRLPAPLVLVNGLPVNVVDLKDLAGSDVIVRVYTTAPDFAVGDQVRLTWVGIPTEGSQIIVEPPIQNVTFVPFQLDYIIPNAAVAAIAKGSASVGYVRVRAGESDRASKNAGVTVEGDISRLAAPIVLEAPGGNLPPDTPWANVEIRSYAGRKPSDLLTLYWLSLDPNNPVFFQDERTVGNIPEGQPVLRSVSNADIRRFDGLRVKVYYVVNDGDTGVVSVRESEAFIMQVGQAGAQFEKPKVDGEANGMLDPDVVAPSGAVVRAPYLGTLVQDVVNMNWRGSQVGGTTSDSVTLTSATAAKPVVFTVPKEYVTKNIGGRVTVDYNIRRAGVLLGSSYPLDMSVGAEQPEMIVENFDKEQDKEITSGQSITTPVMDIHYVTGGGTLSIGNLPPQHPGYPGQLEKKSLNLYGQANTHQHYRFTPNAPCSKCSFWYLLANDDNIVNYYSGGVLLGTRPFTLQGSPRLIEFSSKNITHFEIITISGDIFFLDNFSFWR
ncbi:hypothetical protein [Pseudomonas koreensis]|uniref:Uncharacterized protein n=1 Tax=Pseudomonas koreensis TaxID=198620 RepID=A0A9X3B297_9PSED|nr:hypothetical protein [Pseudomonas koreensis]MCU7247936.1 hypothetical protein [Pseudomonas koreensis]